MDWYLIGTVFTPANNKKNPAKQQILKILKTPENMKIISKQKTLQKNINYH